MKHSAKKITFDWVYLCFFQYSKLEDVVSVTTLHQIFVENLLCAGKCSGVCDNFTNHFFHNCNLIFRLSSEFFIPDIVFFHFKIYICLLFCHFHLSADFLHLFILMTMLYVLTYTYNNFYKVNFLIPTSGFSWCLYVLENSKQKSDILWIMGVF